MWLRLLARHYGSGCTGTGSLLRCFCVEPVTDAERKYVYGILGIAKLFGCSLPTANRIKKSGKIDKAITQIGRKIIVDAELALELAGKKTGGRK